MRSCQRPVTVTECGRYPGTLSVAFFAVERKLLRFMIRIGGIIVVIGMATCTSVGRVGVIALVAIITTCTGVRTHNRIK